MVVDCLLAGSLPLDSVSPGVPYLKCFICGGMEGSNGHSQWQRKLFYNGQAKVGVVNGCG